MFSLSGSDWLGLGTTFSSLSKGTELCGSRPLTGSTEAYDKCVQESLQMMKQTAEATRVQQQQQRKQRNTLILIVAISSILVVTILLLRTPKP